MLTVRTKATSRSPSVRTISCARARVSTRVSRKGSSDITSPLKHDRPPGMYVCGGASLSAPLPSASAVSLGHWHWHGRARRTRAALKSRNTSLSASSESQRWPACAVIHWKEGGEMTRAARGPHSSHGSSLRALLRAPALRLLPHHRRRPRAGPPRIHHRHRHRRHRRRRRQPRQQAQRAHDG
jgi:hypothetical protein